jgi:glutaminyl-tRNA synthetase
MYSFAHPIEDAIEKITYSLCTLEFEEQRILYDWVVEHTKPITNHIPKQYEFSRLNVENVITSKRKLNELVSSGVVDGWDDIRMPTISGMRRKGYTPESIKSFVKSLGISKSDSEISYSVLEQHLRNDLEHKAKRVMGVEIPLTVSFTNWEELFGDKTQEYCSIGDRPIILEKNIYIEQSDFSIEPPKGYKRLYIGNKVRLKGAYVIECIGYESGVVYANIFADTKSGTVGADSVKVKTAITWINPNDCMPVSIAKADGMTKSISSALVEKCDLTPETHYQIERNGYFVVDRYIPNMLNKTCSLRD